MLARACPAQLLWSADSPHLSPVSLGPWGESKRSRLLLVRHGGIHGDAQLVARRSQHRDRQATGPRLLGEKHGAAYLQATAAANSSLSRKHTKDQYSIPPAVLRINNAPPLRLDEYFNVSFAVQLSKVIIRPTGGMSRRAKPNH